jgi:hypothetical protein
MKGNEVADGFELNWGCKTGYHDEYYLAPLNFNGRAPH